MDEKKILIANRGEVAIRISRAAYELGLPTVAVYAEDDHRCLHIRKADEAIPLRGSGPGAYLDGDQLLVIAKNTGCSLIHPGYGFLSENPDFAQRCEQAGHQFVGPKPATLALLGNKVEARKLAERCGIPTIPGTKKKHHSTGSDQIFFGFAG